MEKPLVIQVSQILLVCKNDEGWSLKERTSLASATKNAFMKVASYMLLLLELPSSVVERSRARRGWPSLRLLLLLPLHGGEKVEANVAISIATSFFSSSMHGRSVRWLGKVLCCCYFF